ncbi:MAG: hypothetical protein LKG98_08285, partial [Solobacterium sp.]|nr:hypothetical protein [Solobacterium sp.]MCI1408232.1 hypothetical protein [Solobacterium sp.]
MSDNNQIETCNPEYLTADIMKSLCQYQISHLNREINDFLVLNRASDQCLFTVTPQIVVDSFGVLISPECVCESARNQHLPQITGGRTACYCR